MEFLGPEIDKLRPLSDMDMVAIAIRKYLDLWNFHILGRGSDFVEIRIWRIFTRCRGCPISVVEYGVYIPTPQTITTKGPDILFADPRFFEKIEEYADEYIEIPF